MKIEKQNFSIGFTKNAERLNGIFAMIGFLLILVIEIINKRSIVFLFD